MVPGKAGKVARSGVTVDANSLYPSRMHSASGNAYPVGEPTFFKKRIPPRLMEQGFYYFVRIECTFQIKPGFLPFIQIKNNPLYSANEMLTTSDVYNRRDNSYYHWIETPDGPKEVTVTMTLCCTDFVRFLEFYDVNYTVLDGCYFRTEIGIFDHYIDKYRKQKENSTGAVREEAKLFSNNLYGKLGASEESSYKLAYLDEDGVVRYRIIEEYHKKPGYIPAGAAVTGYARDCTIRYAQMNYHGPDKPGFIMADTDSLHCDLPKEELIGVPLDDKKYQYWKVEREWKFGWFVRQKCYIESDLTEEQLASLRSSLQAELEGLPENQVHARLKEEYLKGNYDIKCAGMPDSCKMEFFKGLMGFPCKVRSPDKPVLQTEDFNIGLRIFGKLRPKRYSGGIVLIESEYTMHDIKGVWH